MQRLLCPEFIRLAVHRSVDIDPRSISRPNKLILTHSCIRGHGWLPSQRKCVRAFGEIRCEDPAHTIADSDKVHEHM